MFPLGRILGKLMKQIPFKRMPRIWRKRRKKRYESVEVGKSVHRETFNMDKT